MGLFSSSKSNTQNQFDANPQTIDEGAGIYGDGSSISITDGGIVARALDSIDKNNATNGAGFSALLSSAGDLFGLQSKAQVSGFDSLINVAGDLFNQGQGLIGQTQKAVADAYGQAQNDKAGTIDNRTLIALAAAAVVGLFLFQRKRA